jgi:hypothetical protein
LIGLALSSRYGALSLTVRYAGVDMREIKFRAWSIEQKKMIGSNKLNFHEYVSVEDQFKDDEYIFMQYAGGKDFLYTDVYEGDIVFLDAKMKVGEIVMDCFAWKIKIEDEYEWLCDWYEDIHVIGNIHQNPDLLENR